MNALHHTNKFQKHSGPDYGERCPWIANKRANMSQTSFDIQRAAVVGAGTMGRGIVMCLANAGITVQWVDNNPEMLEQALLAVAQTYDHSVRQGRIDQDEADARIARVTRADDYAAIRNVDLVIEAVYENLELKQKIFRELDGLLKPEAILASNTSALDIDAIAAATRRPSQVLGLHFFSPAHIMKLLEIVRGAQTSKTVLDAALVLGKRMGKVSVVSGNCHGFIGNRMLHPYVLEARKMLLEGAFPHQVDAALQGFGFAMGPFRMYDVVGIDLEWRARELAGKGQEAPRCKWITVCANWGVSARKVAMGTITTSRAAARPSMTPRSTRWCCGSVRRWGSSVARLARRKSLSAACWRWSTKARRFCRKASPSRPMISTWSTSTATGFQRTRAARWLGPTSRDSTISMHACWNSKQSRATSGSLRA
jgi:3-hydroxyacyl-CoA dehydrogenase